MLERELACSSLEFLASPAQIVYHNWVDFFQRHTGQLAKNEMSQGLVLHQ